MCIRDRVSAGGDAGSGGAQPASGVVTVTTGAAGPGFLVPAQRLAVITESDLTGSAGGSGTSTKDMRRMPSRRRNQVDPLALQPGEGAVDRDVGDTEPPGQVHHSGLAVGGGEVRDGLDVVLGRLMGVLAPRLLEAFGLQGGGADGFPGGAGGFGHGETEP